MRQKVLERCGWQFVRIRGYEYYTNREKALEPLWNMIKITDSQSLITKNLIELSNEPNIVIQIEEETIEEKYEEIEINNDLIDESDVFSNPMILEKNLSSLFDHVQIKKINESNTIQNKGHAVSNPIVNKTLFDKVIELNSIVKIKYYISNKILTVQIVDYQVRNYNKKNGIQVISLSSPLAKSIIGKSIGDLVRIDETETKVEIIEVE